MALSRKTVEAELHRASKALDKCTADLKKKNFDPKTMKRHSTFKKLNSRLRQIKQRLRRIDAIEKLDQSLRQAKATSEG